MPISKHSTSAQPQCISLSLFFSLSFFFLSLSSLSLFPSLSRLISKGFNRQSVVHRACQCKCECCCSPLGKRRYLFVFLSVSFSQWQPLTFYVLCAAVNSDPDFSHFSLRETLLSLSLLLFLKLL